jgi:hypothetical protein
MRVNWMNVDEKSQGGSAKLSIADNYQNEAAIISFDLSACYMPFLS